jgi:hypothetical protein
MKDQFIEDSRLMGRMHMGKWGNLFQVWGTLRGKALALRNPRKTWHWRLQVIEDQWWARVKDCPLTLLAFSFLLFFLRYHKFFKSMCVHVHMYLYILCFNFHMSNMASKIS